MTTILQSISNRIKPKLKKVTFLKKCPQKSGKCLDFFKNISPRKPNSAKRKVVKLKLSTGKIIRSQLPGLTPVITLHKEVLVKGGRVRDLPGIKSKIIRGVLGVSGVIGRKTSRSKYGVKKTN